MAIDKLNDMLRKMVASGAASLQFRPGQPPLVFVNGDPRPLGQSAMTPGTMSALVDQIIDGEQLAGLVGRGQVDGHYRVDELGAFHFRVRRLPEGMALAFRRMAEPRGGARPPSARSQPPAPDARPAGAVGRPDSARSRSRHADGLVAPPRSRASSPTGPERRMPGAGDSSINESVGGSLGSAGRVTGSVAAAPDEPEWLAPFTRAGGIPGLLEAMIDAQAADLVLSCGRAPRVRKIGEYRAVPGHTIDERRLLDALGEVMTPARRQRLDDTGSLDLGFELHRADGNRARFRVNVFRTMSGLAAAFRPIWETVPELSTLGLPPSLHELADFPHGLVLITGPTGSGKSTTLSALVDHLNKTRRRHILTLEDPIEYLFKDDLSIIHQREVGVHVESFSSGLRAALREAPDVILLGEMRDLDTIAAAITAAETGHLVMSTLHAGSAIQAIDRMIDVFPEHQQPQIRQQLADVLRGLVTQRLLPRPDGLGRVPAIELVRVNFAISNMIRERRTHQFNTTITSGRKDGMVPWDISVLDLARRGQITRETALRVARDQNYVRGALDA